MARKRASSMAAPTTVGVLRFMVFLLGSVRVDRRGELLQRACQKPGLVISGGYGEVLSGFPDRAPGTPDVSRHDEPRHDGKRQRTGQGREQDHRETPRQAS